MLSFEEKLQRDFIQTILAMAQKQSNLEISRCKIDLTITAY